MNYFCLRFNLPRALQAAVAGGEADVGLGTDTAGSVRVPASYCGLYGVRPSHERVDLRGCAPMAPSFDTGDDSLRPAPRTVAVLVLALLECTSYRLSLLLCPLGFQWHHKSSILITQRAGMLGGLMSSRLS